MSDEHYRVERDAPDCLHCANGGSWTVASGEGDEAVQIGRSFAEASDAEDLCQDMNHAFAEGWQAAWLERVKSYAAGELSQLPLPRLQITWRALTEDHYNWLAEYALLVPVKPGDIRNDTKCGYLCLPLGGTKTSGGSPITPDGRVETPFRDGVHIRFDAAALKLPMFAVCGERWTQLEAMP